MALNDASIYSGKINEIQLIHKTTDGWRRRSCIQLITKSERSY